jgi:hypothetical protein
VEGVLGCNEKVEIDVNDSLNGNQNISDKKETVKKW